MTKIIKIVLAVFLILCLFHFPYGFYVFVRFIAFVGFSALAYLAYKEQKNIEGGLYKPTEWVFNAIGAIGSAITSLNKSMGTGSSDDFYYSGSPKY